MIRCPHSRQRIGSLGLISFFAPQSGEVEYSCKKSSTSARTCADVLHILPRRRNVCASACISVHGCLLLAHTSVFVNACENQCENRDSDIIWKVTFILVLVRWHTRLDHTVSFHVLRRLLSVPLIILHELCISKQAGLQTANIE
jgi:hypothetical protein